MLDIEVPHVESPALRRAGKELLSLALIDARNHSLRWAAALEQVLGPPLAVPEATDLDPPLWTLGRAGWFQERWVGRNMQRERGERCDPTQTRLASILPGADTCYERLPGSPAAAPAGAAHAALPDLQATRDYLVETLETTLELLDATRGDDDASLYFYRLALFNEDQQLEALAELAQTVGFDTGLLRPLQTLATRPPLFFPATRWSLGSPPGGFAFDRERAAHEVAVPEFEIDAQAVAWSQYGEFVEDGGYDERRFWSDAGWDWLQREGRRTPRHVDQLRQGVLQRRFGRLARVPLQQPVTHVAWYEADAWCRWAGRRLPSEVEWEAAAHQGASRGLRWGDVWEWTATTARPYPGYVAGPASEGRGPAFGTAKVLRGASFATRGRIRHPKFRRFEAAHADSGFFGFRSCVA